MHILILTPYYTPDLGPSAPLFTMLSIALVRRGHRVTVITTVPHYPSGKVSAPFLGKMVWRSFEDGVEVIRVTLPSLERASLPKRLLQFICYQIGATWVGRHHQYDVAIVANPSLWVWLPFSYLIVLRRKSAVFSIHDVYPDVGINLGIFRHRSVITAVSSLERFCLNHSSVVRILSESFRPGLRALGVPDDKMTLIYDWVDTELVHPMPRDNAFSREHDLSNKFVVLYAGNLGLSQGLEHVLAAAEILSDHDDLQFVFVGAGAGRDRLVADADRRGLTNVRFLPFQPRERLSEVLASSDASLVILRKGIGMGSLPSKTFSIMASGRAVVASVDEESETWSMLKRSKAGICIPPESADELARAILTLKQDKCIREHLGRNGRDWVERHHSPQHAAERFEKLLLSINRTGKSERIPRSVLKRSGNPA